MPDIQKAKCFEFAVQILPPLRSSLGEGAKKFTPLSFISVYALGQRQFISRPSLNFIGTLCMCLFYSMRAKISLLDR